MNSVVKMIHELQEMTAGRNWRVQNNNNPPPQCDSRGHPSLLTGAVDGFSGARARCCSTTASPWCFSWATSTRPRSSGWWALRLKMMNFAFKMMDFTMKMMNFSRSSRSASTARTREDCSNQAIASQFFNRKARAHAILLLKMWAVSVKMWAVSVTGGTSAAVSWWVFCAWKWWIWC